MNAWRNLNIGNAVWLAASDRNFLHTERPQRVGSDSSNPTRKQTLAFLPGADGWGFRRLKLRRTQSG